jgi:hypothetical protein
MLFSGTLYIDNGNGKSAEGGSEPSRSDSGHLRGARSQGRQRAPAFLEIIRQHSDNATLRRFQSGIAADAPFCGRGGPWSMAGNGG